MEIKASDIKALRDSTGAGMMDCKRALQDSDGDIEKATKLLKEKGLAAVAKRADRATAEGRIFIKRQGNKIAMVEVVCETDFVSKGDEFIALGEKLVDLTLEKGYTKVETAHTDMFAVLAAKTRENMSVSRLCLLTVPDNAVAGTYIHSDFKIGVICIVNGSTDAKAAEFANDCCLHMAAYTPAYITQKDVPQSYIDEQNEIFQKQMEQDEKMAGKPQNVKDNIIKNKLKKHLEESCFVDQMFVKDDKLTVSAKLAEIAKSVGADLSFGEIVLYVLGK
ncbi:MAG: elongation factor Ts [Treponema sp.]|nr:elongation factor Ts [Treponema sp.]